MDFPRDRRRQFVLQRQHVARVPLETLGPKIPVRPSIDQLGGDPNLVAGSKHRALHDRVDVERLSDLRGRRPTASLELHRRAAGDHANLADDGKLRRELVGHALGEVVLAGIARVVVERKHGDRSDGDGFAPGVRRARRESRTSEHVEHSTQQDRRDRDPQGGPFPRSTREGAGLLLDDGLGS